MGSVRNSITELPKSIIDGIKSIFIPDTEVVQQKFGQLLNELKQKFNFDTQFFENIFSGEEPVKDIEGDYNINGVGNIKLKFFDTKYLIQGVEYFRPFIRGFIVLLLAFYNIKQLLSFIRQDAGIVTGKAVDMGGKK